ncbi:MAG TPA: TIGR03560 family F420-dependent LLM class oxidoreductase [Acidimicrobiales bacterium]|nr:TIGR03560 family F420-dependent LLM class oxidoreductase [Acidimicrobiales bacterium]
MPVGFGYRVEQYNASYEQLEGTAKLAEELGYDGLWLNDHFVPDPISGRYEAPTLECWTTAGALARATTRVRIGFMTLCNGYRWPSITAKMVTTLDNISGGRVNMGLGAGWHEDEFAMFGIPYPAPRVRLDQLVEGLEIIQGMFANEQFTFQGEYFSVEGVWNNPRPVQQPRPPVWIGGGGEKRMLRIVAKYADWHNLVVTPLDTFRHKMEILDGHCTELGRDPKSLRRSLNPSLLLRETEEDFERYAEERAQRRSLTVNAYLELLESQGTIFGGPDRVEQMLRDFESAGCEYFEFIIRESDQETPLRRFADLVMPKFS